MSRLPASALSAALAFVLLMGLGSPALAQRGQPGGDRGQGSREGSRGNMNGSHGQPRGDAQGPRRGATGSASLISPRPGVDLFRAAPGTYDARSVSPGLPSGPSWGGLPVSRGPSWGGTPINRPDLNRPETRRDGDRDRRGPRHGRPGQPRGSYGYPVVVYGAPYGYLPYTGAQPYTVVQPPTGAQPTVTAAPNDPPDGFLRLLVTPRDADVIVDGVREGIVDDFGGAREQALPAGPHRVRLEAAGYEPVEFDVRVPVGDTISLRRELSLLPAPPHAPDPPAAASKGQMPTARKTFYAIPRCYLGDAMPSAESLPAGCNLSDLRVLAPQ